MQTLRRLRDLQPASPLWWGGAVVIAAVLVATIFFMFGRRHLPSEQSSAAPSALVPAAAHSDPAVADGASRLPTVLPGVAWGEVSAEDVRPDWVPRFRHVDDARLVALAGDLAALAEGDTLAVPIPQTGRVYEPVIARVETLVGTNRSYVGGGVDEEDRRYSFLLTLGARNTFAYIATPEGVYDLVGNARFGWLMPARNIDAHVDYSKPDYHIPGHPDHVP